MHPKGKVVYFIDGKSFENDKGVLNGKQKAVNYCYDNSLNVDDIIKFDSRLERDRYLYLKADKSVSKLEIHKKIMLQREFLNANGDTIPPITYSCDFVYEKEGKIHYEDVKGQSLFTDQRFEIVKALFDYGFKSLDSYLAIVIFRNGERTEWTFGNAKKSPPRSKNKLREELHEKEKKLARMALYLKLKAKEKRTAKQEAKFKELEEEFK